jgi:ribosomal protein S18 acetylase RimI-like enzyme
MIFASATLARRIEVAESRLAVDFADAVRSRWPDVLVAPVGGGAAVFVGPGQPFNKLVGLGLGAAIDEDELAAVERAFDERRAPLQVELATLADGAVATLLTRRGYELAGFENVLALELGAEVVDRLTTQSEASRAAGILVERVGPDAVRSWTATVTAGFMHPDVFDGPASNESFPLEMMERVFEHLAAVAGFSQYLARRQGEIAGGGSLRAFAGLAQLCGAATLPEHRRRGVQSALLRSRLLDAARQGCDLAVVTTQPGSRSQENVQRAGFELLYARAIIVRPPHGERR